MLVIIIVGRFETWWIVFRDGVVEGLVSSETRGKKERKTALDGTNSFLEIVIGSIENIHNIA